MTQQEQLEKNLNKLDAMGQLPVNWDGYDKWIIPPLLIDKCKNLLPKLPYQPDISSTGRGTIYMEYVQPNGDQMSIEYGLDKVTGSYRYSISSGIIQTSEEFDMTNASDEEMHRIVLKFCNYE